MLSVVKVGGRVISTPEQLVRLAESLSRMPGEVVVVHGGGVDISELQERLGIDVLFAGGLRVTTEDGLKAASMALSGWTNKRLVAALVAAGINAVGISGEDGSLIQASVKNAGRLGEVGTVADVQSAVIDTLLAGGFMPVVSPISSGPANRPLNVNADEVAGALAIALRATRLLLVSDTPGVVDRGRVVADLTQSRAASLLAAGVATGGMRIKLQVGMEAARWGPVVRIGDAGILDGIGGTRIGSRKTSQSVA